MRTAATWHRAPTQHEAFFTDHSGYRLYVQRTRRSYSTVPEFEGLVAGVRVDDFGSIEAAMLALEAIAAAKKKPAPSSPEGQNSAG